MNKRIPVWNTHTHTHTQAHTHVHNSGKRLKRRLFIIPDKALRAMTSTPAKEKLAAYSLLKASEGEATPDPIPHPKIISGHLGGGGGVGVFQLPHGNCGVGLRLGLGLGLG